jgi:hypothetical protein
MEKNFNQCFRVEDKGRTARTVGCSFKQIEARAKYHLSQVSEEVKETTM